MNPRAYNEVAHQSSDLICKLEAIRLFSKHPKYKAVLAEDLYQDCIYKADICLINRETGEHEQNLEVEMKRIWENRFPFKDIQFLPRKKEKWDNPDFTWGKPTHWLLFNHDCSQHLVVFDSVIRSLSDIRPVKCQVRGNEDLYVIDLSSAQFNYLQ